MADPHVITALRSKRAEVSGYIHDLEKKVRHLRATLANLDATILLFSPGTDPELIPPRRPYRRSRYFAPGDISKLCAEALRVAEGKPITSLAIAEGIMAERGLPDDDATRRHVAEAVVVVLRGLKRRGRVARIGDTNGAKWVVV
jgi:hypothetical protein